MFGFKTRITYHAPCTGEPCSPEHSTCNGRNELCVGRGPGWPDHFLSNEIIGRRQFQQALQLWNSTKPISGDAVGNALL